MQVGDGVDLALEPAAGLGAGVAGGEGVHAVGRYQFLLQVEAVSGVHPGVELLTVHAERHGGEEAVSGVLVEEVVGGRVRHGERARRDGVVHLEGADLRAGRVDFDVDIAV